MKLELDIQSTQNQNSVNQNGFEANSSEDVKKLLRAGISAAKEGNRAEARSTLLQVTEAEPNNETAWLWLASISEYPEELLVFLHNVLKVNPDNERAIEWAKQTKALLSKTFVQRGIDASHQNQKDFAKQCFLQAIVHDEQNEMAWLWLASSTEVAEEKCSHLQKVLNINPENETAASSMRSVKTQLAQPFLKKASSAAIEGDHETARRNLEDVMKYSPELEEAWVLKAYLTQDFYEKIACYEKALEINPEHDGAKAGLASLQALAPKITKPKEVVDEQQVAVEETVEETVVENESLSSEDLLETVLETVREESAELENFSTDSGEVFTEVFDAPTGDLDESTALNASEVFLGEVSQNDEIVEEAITAPSNVQMVEESAEEVISPELQVKDQVETVQDEVPQETAQTESNQEVEVSRELSVPVETESQMAEAVESMGNSDEFQSTDSESTEDLSTNTVKFEEITYANESVETVANEDLQPENRSVDEIIEDQQLLAEDPQPESEEYFESQVFAEESNEAEVGQQVEASQEDLMPEAETAQDEPTQEEFVAEQAQNCSNNGFEAHSPTEVYADDQQPTVEFSYQTVPVYDAQSFELNSQDVVAPQPNFALVEEAKVEEKVEEEVQTGSSAELVTESTTCPFCETENENQAVSCQSCKAMLSLSDLEMLLSHQNANQEVLLKAIEKMEVEKTIKEFSVKELSNLGIAHLNAHNLRKGFTYLQEASQLNPNDVVLSSKVNFLAIRLSEIEEYDQKAQEHPVQSRTILVVDDSPTVRKLISGKLEKCGHSVVSAVDGMDALAKINEVIPDLILLDITMPRLDGYQVCKLIRNNEVTKDIPVVMISGKDGFFDKVRGRMAGSTGYITKPFGPDTLMKTIETYLA